MADASRDRSTTFFYNENGQLVAELDGENKQTSSTIDEFGRVTKSVTGERVVRYFYSDDGLKTGALDAEGYLTEYKYNAAGETVETIAYARETSDAFRANGTLEQLRPKVHSNDIHTFIYYDNLGRVAGTVDGEGFFTETLVDNDKNLVREIRYKERISTSLSHDLTLDAVRALTDNKKTVTTESYYNDLGQLEKTIDANGYATEYQYDRDGRLTFTIAGIKGTDRSNVRTTSINYDVRGQKTEVLSGGSNSVLHKGSEAETHYEYDDQGRKIAETGFVDGKESKTLYYYDIQGRLVYTINAEGEMSQTTYSAFGEVSGRYLRREAVAELSGLRGGLASTLSHIQSVQTRPSDWITIESNIQFDRRGLKTQSVDAEGRVTTLSYNDFSELERSTSDLNGVTSTVDYRYDNRGLLTRKEQAGSVLVRGYDAFGNLLSITTKDLTTGASRQSLSVIDERGLERFSLNDQGNLIEKTYDHAGRLLTLTEYDASYGDTLVSPSIEQVETWLNSLGAVNKRVTANEYDNAGQLVKVTDAKEESEYYQYDSVGNKISFTNKEGNTWTYQYDQNNRLVKETSPKIHVLSESGKPVQFLSLETDFEYDASGNLLRQIEGAGTTWARITEYDYDKVGRQLTTRLAGGYDAQKGKFVSAGGMQQSITVTYDAQGHAAVNRDLLGNYSYKVYDDSGRVRFEIDQGGYVTEYVYGTATVDGNAYTTTRIVRYANKLNWVSSYTGQVLSDAQVQNMLRPKTTEDRTLTRYFDPQGRLAKVVGDEVTVYANGSDTPVQLSPTTEYQYNGFGEQILERVLISSNNWAETYTYYDTQGRKTAQIDAEGYLTEWRYDAFGQVEKQIEYARKASNISVSGYTKPVNSGNVDDGYDRTTVYTYDALGRVTKRTLTDAGQGTDYNFHDKAIGYYGEAVQGRSSLVTQTDYDRLGNVIQKINADGGVEEIEYDALGREIRRYGVEHLVAKGAISTGIMTEKARHVTEYSYNLFGEQTLQKDRSSANTNGILTRYYLDHRGNRTAVVNGDDIRTAYEYDAAGRVRSESVDVNTANPYFDNKHLDALSYTAKKHYEYDERGPQTATIITGGPSPEYKQSSTYNAFGEISKSGIGGSQQFNYSYDKSGHLVRQTQENGSVAAFGYNAMGQVTRQAQLGSWSDADDRVTHNILDKLGRLVQQKQPYLDKNGNRRGSIQQEFDRWGNIIKSTLEGGTTLKHYNMLNKVIREQLPVTKVMSSDAASSSNINVVQKYYYDAQGNLVESVNGRGYRQRWEYDAAGFLTKQFNQDGVSQSFFYDALGNQTYREDYEGFVFKSDYNARGLVVEQGQLNLDSRKWVIFSNSGGYDYHRYSYDQLGNRISDIIGSGFGAQLRGRVTQSQYDALGNVVASSNLSGAVTHYQYNEFGKKVKEQNANGDSLTWDYDEFGNLTRSTDLAGRQTVYQYNEHKDLISEKVYEYGAEVGGSSAFGAEYGGTDYYGKPNSGPTPQPLITRDYDYWDNGQVKKITETETTGGNWQALTEDLAGWLSTDGKINFEKYVKDWEVSNIRRMETSYYDYNLSGKRTEETHTSERSFTRAAYAKKDNKLIYKDSINISFARSTQNSYDEWGRLKEVRAEQSDLKASVNEHYVAKLDNTNVYGSGSGQVYQHNPMFFGGTESFDTHSAGLEYLRYHYDEVGNRRAVQSSVFAPGALKSDGSESYLYYTYDKQNRIKVSQAADAYGAMQKDSVAFTYDNLGRRTSETNFVEKSTADYQTISYRNGYPAPVTIKLDVDKYRLQRYEYLNASGDISKLYELNVIVDKDKEGRLAKQQAWNANGDRTKGYIRSVHSVNMSSHLLLRTSNEYDAQGRLLNSYTHAKRNGEVASGVVVGDKVSNTHYSWDYGSQLKEQKTYKRTENSTDLQYVTTIEQEKVLSRNDIKDEYGHAITQQAYNNLLANTADFEDVQHSHVAPSPNEDVGPDSPYGGAYTLPFHEIAEGGYTDTQSKTFRAQTGWNEYDTLIRHDPRTVKELHSGYFLDYYTVTESKQGGAYDATVTKSGYFLDDYKVRVEKKRYTTHFGAYTENVRTYRSGGSGQRIDNPVVVDHTKTEYGADIYGNYMLVKKPVFVKRDYQASVEKFDSKYYSHSSAYRDVADKFIVEYGQGTPSTTAHDHSFYETRADGKRYHVKWDARFAVKNYTVKETRFDSKYYNFQNYYQNVADKYISDGTPSSTAHDVSYFETRSDGKRYQVIKDARFTTKKYTATETRWDGKYYSYGSSQFENIRDKYINDYNAFQSGYGAPSATAHDISYTETRADGKRYQVYKDAKFVKKQYTSQETVTDNTYRYYRKYNQDVKDVLVKEVNYNYGGSAPTTRTTTSYQTRSDGKRYKIVKKDHFVLKTWTTSETKRVWVSGSSYGSGSYGASYGGGYQYKTFTTHHKGYFRDYYQVTEYSQRGTYTQNVTKTGWYLDGYTVTTKQQKVTIR